MNLNITIKFVATLTMLFGASSGICHAVDQAPGQPQAFGTVKSAVNHPTAYPTTGQHPPIVSADSLLPSDQSTARALPSIKRVVTTPPIQQSSMLAPIAVHEKPVAAMDQTTAAAEPKLDSKVAPAANWQRPGRRIRGILPRNTSSAGVPIYSNNSGASTLPPIVSSSQEIFAPDEQLVPSVPSFNPDQGSVPFEQPVLPHSNDRQTFFDQAPSASPVFGSSSSSCANCGGAGCSSCGGGAISTCESCGANGCFDSNAVSDQFNVCGSVGSARRYVIADVLYFDRSDGSITNSNFGGLGGFEADYGGRITIGHRHDSIHGNEISIIGTQPLVSSIVRTSATNQLDALWGESQFFFPRVVPAIPASETDPFQNVAQQNERKSTTLHTVEFNKVKWAWDVSKSFIGWRYFYIEDDYSLVSLDATDGIGTFDMDATNHMIGPHVGQEFFYDVGYRLSFSATGKAGIYANFSEMNTVARSGAVTFINTNDKNVTLASSLELGLTAHYQLGQRTRLRAGYDLIYVGDVASISDNLPPFLSPFTGTSTSDSDEMLFHAISIGLEFYR